MLMLQVLGRRLNLSIHSVYLAKAGGEVILIMS